MKAAAKIFLQVILYIWQLPQNIAGLVVGFFLEGQTVPCGDNRVRVRSTDKIAGGVSLGRYVYLAGTLTTSKYIRHELGHCAQSRLLGPLYLLVIGLPSILWAWARGWSETLSAFDYSAFYTEKWADRLGGVENVA